MASLHICYIEMGYPHHHGGGGGAGTYVQLVGKELVRRGHRVSVVTAPCAQCPAQFIDEGIEVYRPSLRRSLHWYVSKIPGIRRVALALRYIEQGWSIARFLDRLHRQHPIDIVEYSEGGDFWHAFRSPFPYIVHLHGSRYTFLRMSGRSVDSGDWHHRRLELAFIRRARYILSPSQTLLDLVAEELGHDLPQSAALPLPLDPRLLQQRELGEVAIDAERIVLFASRNDPVKGADTLLQAVPRIRQSYPAVQFQLIGYTPASGAQLPESVHLYPFMLKEDLLAHYQRADICVVPSLWDNSPNTLYEAMAAGRAIVASRVGGIPELVVDGETGILIQPNDPQQLADALLRLLLNRSEARRMGSNGRARIQQLADLSANVDQRLAHYWQVVADELT